MTGDTVASPKTSTDIHPDYQTKHIRIISDELLETNKEFKFHPQKRYEIGITIRTFDDNNSGTYDAGLT